MTDYFSLLDETRRPWIDPEELKQKFLNLSSDLHPDRVHQSAEPQRESAGARYAVLNSAYNILRSPKERIRHLLELESGAKPADIKPVDAVETEMLFEVGQLCRQVDKFLIENEHVKSPMLKVQLFARAQEMTDELMKLQRNIGGRIEALSTELQIMNTAWEKKIESLPLARLDEIYRLLGYFGRWTEQLQERIVRLAF